MVASDLHHEKYLDWCAGRISERLGGMSAEEVALRLDQELLQENGPGPSLYPHIQDSRTRVLIEALHRELQLPSFAEWLDAYRRDPEAIERDLLFRQNGKIPSQ